MLFIYNALVLGGIETFFVRLAKERHKRGLKTKILLLLPSNRSDSELLSEMKKYAVVYFVNDIFYGNDFIAKVAGKIPLIFPINKKKLLKNFSDVEHMHVTSGMNALLANRIIAGLKNDVVLTVGFYHSLEFSWGKEKLPYFEKKNREFVLDYLPKKNLLLFSVSVLDLYKESFQVDLEGAQTFRIGVINKPNGFQHNKKYYENNSSTLKICSVGRLVDFKTYNMWMIDVVCALNKKGINAVYHVYGDGFLKDKMRSKIRELGLQNNVLLKGNLNYSYFNETVKEYDVFVGSGTAIIQAASLGVCSLVGIESISTPKTFGFFSNVADVDYNLGCLPIEQDSVLDILLEFHRMSAEKKNNLSCEHLKVMEQFYIEKCLDNFEAIKKLTDRHVVFVHSKLLYEMNFKFHYIFKALFKKHFLNKRYV